MVKLIRAKNWKAAKPNLPKNVAIAKSKRVRVVAKRKSSAFAKIEAGLKDALAHARGEPGHTTTISFKGVCADCGSGSFALENGRCPECVRVVSKAKAHAAPPRRSQ